MFLMQLAANPNDPKLRAALLAEITPDAIAATREALAFLGPNLRIIADEMDRHLVALSAADTPEACLDALLAFQKDLARLTESLDGKLGELEKRVPF